MSNPIEARAIEIYIGKQRGGKNISVVADTYEELPILNNFGYTIYSNFHLNKKYFPDYKYLDNETLIKMYKNKTEFIKCIFLIDELHIFADCREHNSDSNKAIGYLAGQLGKRGNVLRGCTHFMDLVEKRIRLYTEKIIEITKGFLIDNIFYPIENNNSVLTDEENNFLCIQGKHWELETNGIFKLKEIRYIMAKKYFNIYDTYELIIKEKEKN